MAKKTPPEKIDIKKLPYKEQLKKLPWDGADKFGLLSNKDGELYFTSDNREFVERNLAQVLIDQVDKDHYLHGHTFVIVERK